MYSAHMLSGCLYDVITDHRKAPNARLWVHPWSCSTVGKDLPDALRESRTQAVTIRAGAYCIDKHDSTAQNMTERTIDTQYQTNAYMRPLSTHTRIHPHPRSCKPPLAPTPDPTPCADCIRYKDPDFNTTFDGYCSRTNCTCAAIEKLAVGREAHPMCHGPAGHHHGHGFSSNWGLYIEGLACKTLGNWYSTQAAGQCKAGQSHADCWWELKETKRTVNASCVDTRVIEAVQARRPECWKECPPKEVTNRTSACFLTCLFETMLGK